MDVLATSVIHDLVTMGVPVVDKVARTVLVYGGLLALLRLAGKRDLAQLNSFDLVVLLLLSNVVQNAVIGPDNSLWGGMLGAVVLIALNAVLVRGAVRFDRVRLVLEGNPTTVVRDGRIIPRALHTLGLRENEVVTAVRRQGASTIDEVADATLGAGGTIEVTLRAEDENATKGDLARIDAKLDALLAAVSPFSGPAADGPLDEAPDEAPDERSGERPSERPSAPSGEPPGAPSGDLA